MEKGVGGEEVRQRIMSFADKKNLKIHAFEKTCGLGNDTIRKIGPNGPSTSVISRIIGTFPEISADWLISGKEAPTSDANAPGVPLLPFSAMAGYMAENNGLQGFSGEKVYLPDFAARGADFAIRVDGDSMYPKYNGGDVLVCRILTDKTLFDYGRVYVLSTRNGCVIKRVFRGGEHSVMLHSENQAYKDYELDVDDILAVAIVIGHAGLE